jgi:serine/threonine protein kinase
MHQKARSTMMLLLPALCSYMTPEQLTGQAATVGDPAKVDVWGLMVSWLDLLTGQGPVLLTSLDVKDFWSAPNSQQRLHDNLDYSYGPYLPAAVTPALAFFKWALVVDVAARPTAAQVLAHPYISSPLWRQQQQQQ